MRSFNLLALMCSLLLCSCSRNSDSLKTAEQFFASCDAKDFKSAYSLLSDEDKSAFSPDSFYVMLYKADEDIARPGSLESKSVFIKDETNDTLSICQVWRLPDYSLIQKTKGKDTKFADFFRKMEETASVPMTLDSSRTVLVVKQKGAYVVHLGLSNLRKYRELIDSLTLSYISRVSITPISIAVSKNGYASYMGKGSVRIDNGTDFPMTGFTCSLYVGGHAYKEECLDWIVSEVGAHHNKVVSTYLSGEDIFLAKYVPVGDYIGTVPPSAIDLKVKSVYFADTLSTLIHNESLVISGFKYFHFFKPGISKYVFDH